MVVEDRRKQLHFQPNSKISGNPFQMLSKASTTAMSAFSSCSRVRLFFLFFRIKNFHFSFHFLKEHHFFIFIIFFVVGFHLEA